MENIKFGKRREGRWTPIRAKAQDTRANPNSWETHLVRKRWAIGLLRALSPRLMMMMMICQQRLLTPLRLLTYFFLSHCRIRLSGNFSFSGVCLIDWSLVILDM